MSKFLVFAIDSGAESGWAVADCPEFPLVWGTTTTAIERKNACECARNWQDQLQLPLIVVAEQWTLGGPRAHYKMFIGLGKNYGRWLDHIEGILRVPEKDIVRPTPQLWRNGIFGSEMVKEHSVDDGMGLKRLACAFMSPINEEPVINHNAAEAGCMACWGHCSEEGADAYDKAARLYAILQGIG